MNIDTKIDIIHAHIYMCVCVCANIDIECVVDEFDKF